MLCSLFVKIMQCELKVPHLNWIMIWKENFDPEILKDQFTKNGFNDTIESYFHILSSVIYNILN